MRFIGCKTLLLEHIHDVIKEKVKDASTFCDIFSGTGSVGRFFKQYYEVYSNDLLYFSYVLQKATIENDIYPTFKKLKIVLNIEDPIDYINYFKNTEIELLDKKLRFFQNNYAPIGGRMYLTNQNALRIDYARNLIENWHKDKIINDNEYFYLLACIVEGIPFVSNISGTYGAFHKTWDKRTSKQFELKKLPVLSNCKNNKSYNCDGVELLKHIKGDILYVDPPYNERQYLPNYHVLETAAKYDMPNLKGITGQREYQGQKSEFCSLKSAKNAFEKLMKYAQFRHIILSYSTDGLIPLIDIENIMKTYGIPNTFQIYEIPYRRYKSREQGEKEKLKELIIYVEKKCI